MRRWLFVDAGEDDGADDSVFEGLSGRRERLLGLLLGKTAGMLVRMDIHKSACTRSDREMHTSRIARVCTEYTADAEGTWTLPRCFNGIFP